MNTDDGLVSFVLILPLSVFICVPQLTFNIRNEPCLPN